jgi:hypothetical protein
MYTRCGMEGTFHRIFKLGGFVTPWNKITLKQIPLLLGKLGQVHDI